MEFSRSLLRGSYRAIRSVTRAVPWLRRLRPRTKRRLLATTLGRWSAGWGTPARPFVVDGVRLLVPPDLAPTYVLQDYEPVVRAFVAHHLRSGMAFADVGANIGLMTLLAAKQVGPSGRVYALEPAPENLRWLRRNVELNEASCVRVVGAAAGATHGSCTLFLGPLGTTHSLAAQSSRTIEVDVVRLDEVIERPLDLVKIDVEGYELEVLEGMRGHLSVTPLPSLILEWSPALLRLAGHQPAELPAYLSGSGYRVSVLDDPQGRSVEQLLEALEGRDGGRPWRVDLLAEPQ